MVVAGPAHGQQALETELDWFSLEPTLLAAAGRSAAEFWKDAERHLKGALAIQPCATDIAYTLAQVYYYVMGGDRMVQSYIFFSE